MKTMLHQIVVIYVFKKSNNINNSLFYVIARQAPKQLSMRRHICIVVNNRWNTHIATLIGHT